MHPGLYSGHSPNTDLMATIVNTPGSSGSAGGWIIAGVLLIVVVLIALFVWPGYGRVEEAAPASMDVNVTIPTPGDSSTPAP